MLLRFSGVLGSFGSRKFEEENQWAEDAVTSVVALALGCYSARLGHLGV